MPGAPSQLFLLSRKASQNFNTWTKSVWNYKSLPALWTELSKHVSELEYNLKAASRRNTDTPALESPVIRLQIGQGLAKSLHYLLCIASICNIDLQKAYDQFEAENQSAFIKENAVRTPKNGSYNVYGS